MVRNEEQFRADALLEIIEGSWYPAKSQCAPGPPDIEWGGYYFKIKDNKTLVSVNRDGVEWEIFEADLISELNEVLMNWPMYKANGYKGAYDDFEQELVDHFIERGGRLVEDDATDLKIYTESLQAMPSAQLALFALSHVAENK